MAAVHGPAQASSAWKKALLLALLAAAPAAFYLLGLGRYLSLEAIKANQAVLSAATAQHPIAAATLFFFGYVLVTATSVPGAALLTLVAGALFGLLEGTALVSFASSIGATLAFLSARYLLRDTVQARFGPRLAEISAGLERDGALHLFLLRLVPLVPFLAVNLVLGLTRMRTGTFYLVSQAGMLAGTMVFVDAGTQLAGIESIGGILSPRLLASFALLGLFPVGARWLVARVRRRLQAVSVARSAAGQRDL
jgi:uncharacterized membrane protein YdjX (TVP38/TMEM64 family)